MRQKQPDGSWIDLGPGVALSSTLSGTVVTGQVIGRPAIRRDVAPKPLPLSERVCKRGHVGQYVRPRADYPYCVECVRLKWRERKQRQRAA